MSDTMLFGVLQMPYEMAMADELSRQQFYWRVQEVVERMRRAEAALALVSPPECQSEAEKLAFAFGWWKAMELQNAQHLAKPCPCGTRTNADCVANTCEKLKVPADCKTCGYQLRLDGLCINECAAADDGTVRDSVKPADLPAGESVNFSPVRDAHGCIVLHNGREVVYRDEASAERNRCAQICANLATLMEQGAGDPEPGGRLRQAERMIRNGDTPGAYGVGRPALSSEDRAILEAVHRELDEGDGNNAPGHAHSRPGIWDNDNKPDIAGRPCAWCLTWAKFTRLIQQESIGQKEG